MHSKLLNVSVLAKQPEAAGIVSLQLGLPGGDPLPPFSPGAHVDLHLQNGMVRQYSLAGDCSDTSGYRIGVLRDPQSRGGSVYLVEQIHVGDALRISAPRNRFQLAASDHAMLFAGGIGITPILSMVTALQGRGTHFTLHYSCRSRSRAAFLDDLQPLLTSGQAQLHLDDEAATALDLDTALAQAERERAHLYICGPAGYITHVQTAARAAGIAQARIHVERFVLDEAQRQQQQLPGQPFEIQIASTGEVFQIGTDETITDVLERHGIYVPTSCEEGICGTCLTQLLAGTPDHRDHYLTDEEHSSGELIMPCCSRAKSGMLILDL